MPDGVLRVAQLNIGSLLEPRWDDRQQEIVAWLDHLDPDVVCLEEAWEDDRTENTAGWIAGAAGFQWWFGGEPFAADLWADDTLRFGSAVLSRWPIDDHAYHRLPVGADARGFVAGVPWELVHVRTAGLDVFACHLAAAPTDGLHRRLQVLAIDEIVRAVRRDLDEMPGLGRTRPAMPAVLCGDFNAEPGSDEIRFLCGQTPFDGRTAYWQDAWIAAGDGPGHTHDWRGNEIAAPMNVPRKRVDYVFVGDPFLRANSAGRIVSAALAFDRQLTGVVASDHRGLVVDVVWPDRPAR